MAETTFLQRTDSTNSVAYSMAEKGAAHGTAVIAETQTQGRGRLGKEWQSPLGKGLYCSFIIRPRIALGDYPLITMSAGLGVALALDSLCGIEFGLKWPNDIFRSGKKCGGILVESSPLTNPHSDHFAIVGIGINVNSSVSDFPAEISRKATSLYLESGKIVEKQLLFETIKKQLMEHVYCLEKDEFAAILQRWRQKDILVGQQLQWVTKSKIVVEGISLGPDDRGRLRIRDKEGVTHEVLSGDISQI